MNEGNGSYRPTWIEIDLGAIAHNTAVIQKKISPETELLISVKADAYGHGAFSVAKFLQDKGVAFFGVATVDEAVALRKSEIRTPLLILNAILEKEVDAVPEYDLTQTLCSEESAGRLDASAERWKKKIPVHLKVDTGMGRLGVWYEEACALARFVKGCRNLFIEGLYTHLANADDAEPDVTRLQINRFQELADRLKKEGLLPRYIHLANSAAALQYPSSHFNLVRPGLAIYGIDPYYETGKKFSFELRPALKLLTRIVFFKKTPAGRRISYGGTYVTQKETAIGTLPIGYADGYNRLLSNQAFVLIRGRRFPVCGRVCMDQTMVDLGGLPDVSTGEEVVLIGRQGDEEIRVEELSSLCHTIPYEFLCRLSNRIPRVYLNFQDASLRSESFLSVKQGIDKVAPSSV